jgi:hypothetical protein
MTTPAAPARPARKPTAPRLTSAEAAGAPSGQHGLVQLGLGLGVLLMTVQLWLLTISFNLVLAGQRRGTLLVAAGSGLIFVGGLVMLRLLGRRPPRRA